MTLGRALLAMLGGLAMWASFAPFHMWPLAFLGIAVLIALLERRSVRASAATGFLFGLGYFAPLLWWAWTAAGTPLAWIALSCFQASYLALLGVIWQGLLRGPATGGRALGRALALPAAWVGIEQVRATWPLGGLPWGMAAFGQVDSPLLRLAPLGSTELVAFVLVASAALLEFAVVNPAGERSSTRVLAASAGVLAVFLPWFAPLAGPSDETIRVAFAQGTVARPNEEVEGLRALAVTRGLREETSKIPPGSFDVLVLPESTSDIDFRTDPDAGALVRDIALGAGTPVLLGTQEYARSTRTNDYVALDGDRIIGAYSKQHPVPFGEYAPWREAISRITSAIDQITIDMVPGQGPAILDVPIRAGVSSDAVSGDGAPGAPQASADGEMVRVAVPICFEIGDAKIVSEAMREGAQLLVVPTNNASFADTAESAQQFDITRFRAVESGRAAVQVSTVGISGAIEPNGVVLTTTDRWSSEHRVVSLGLRRELTPAAANANQIAAASLGLGGLVAALALGQLALYRDRRKGGTAPHRHR